MKGILKKIGSAFVEMEESPVPKPTAPPKVSVVQQAVQPVYTAVSPEYQEFKDQFAKILEDENKRNYPGNDYFEFIQMKNAMNAVPQEDIKYKAAFAGWATGGNQTKKSLLDTGQIYLALVDKEIEEFKGAYKAQYDRQVVENEKKIDAKSQRVSVLVEEMNKLNAEIQSLKQENIVNTTSLTTKHDAFMSAGQAQRQEILDELDKINHFIS